MITGISQNRAKAMYRGMMAFPFLLPSIIPAFRIAKTDFHQLAIEVQCAPNGTAAQTQPAEIIEFGYVGEGKFGSSNPTSNSTRPGEVRVLLGFPEDRFDWNKFTQKMPGSETRLAVLNQISSSGENLAFLTLWKQRRDSLEFTGIFPGTFSIPVGEFSFRGAPKSSGGGVLLLLQGIGSDAGINVQSFFAVRLRGMAGLEKSRFVSNKSEIPVTQILTRINEGQPPEAVTDSTLRCDLGKSGQVEVLNCTKSRARILYTREGPQETPLASERFTLNVPPFGRGGN